MVASAQSLLKCLSAVFGATAQQTQLWAKPSSLPVLIKEVLLEHSCAHLRILLASALPQQP